ncbi:MAG: dockerin type I repeat-containing protein [Ruminococcus sp.]
MGLAFKKIISFSMTVFMLLSVIIIGFEKTSAVNNEIGDFKGYNTKVIYKDNKIYFSALKDKHLYIKELTSDNREMNLEFEEKIIDFAINKDIVYTITRSKLVNNSYFLHKSDKPESSENFYFSMYSKPNMVVNNKGCIFLLNSKKSVCSLDMKGNTITDNIISANKLIDYKGNTYAVSYDGICKLSDCGVISRYAYDKSYNICNISENYFANDNGEIFEFTKNVKEIVDTDNTLLPYCGETNKYLVSYQKNHLVGYDKSNGDLLVEYEINYTPYYLTAYKDKIYTITKNQSTYSYNVYSESNVFAEEKSNDVSENKFKLSFKDYRLNGKYIFIPQGTTKAVFKNNIVYDGYTISFNSNRRIIGTDEKVTFSGNKKNKTYTFIVLGDLTGEGNINTLDRKAMFGYLLGTKSLTKAFLVSSDLNKDDKITNIDLVKLERKRKSLL